MPIIKRKKYPYTMEGKKELVKDLNKIEAKLESKKHQENYNHYLTYKNFGTLEAQKEAKNIKTSTRKLIAEQQNMQNALINFERKQYGLYGYKKSPLDRPKSKPKRKF